MSTTETTAAASRPKQISDRLLEIAPYPETREAVSAEALARYLAVRAQVISWQQLSPDAPFSRSRVDLLTVLFAASHALFAQLYRDQEHAELVAREIWEAWEDGAGIGGFLWQHLGQETCHEVNALADELAVLQRPAGGLLAHADPIRHALNRAALEAGTANHRDACLKALTALENELEQVRERGSSDEKGLRS